MLGHCDEQPCYDTNQTRPILHWSSTLTVNALLLSLLATRLLVTRILMMKTCPLVHHSLVHSLGKMIT